MRTVKCQFERTNAPHAQLGLDMIMFPQYVNINDTESLRGGTCVAPCGCLSGCMRTQPPMQARAFWGSQAANVSSVALSLLNSQYSIFPSRNVGRFTLNDYADACCDNLWMPPIRFINAEAICAVNYRLFIATCGEEMEIDRSILADIDKPIIQKHCAAQNKRTNFDIILGWSVHWEGTMSMRVRLGFTLVMHTNLLVGHDNE